MSEFTKPLAEEYWRPAPTLSARIQGHSFQTRGKEAFCAVCGTPYAPGALFCYLCGLGREGDLQAKKQNPMNWFNIEALRTQFGLSTLSLACLLVAAICILAAVMTGLVYNIKTLAEWQAVQSWRIEWLLATVVALAAARLFRRKP